MGLPLQFLSGSLLSVAAFAASAQFNPASVTVEPAAVARRFPDPDVRYNTPGFKPGRQDFTTHAEMLAFLEEAARRSTRLKVEMLGRSQRGLPIPLVIMTGGGRIDPTLPTVLFIAQQHGNEPAGGEAALALIEQLMGPDVAQLARANVLVIPRGNPDGAENFTRVTASGIDVNRDHLLLNTPEGRAIALAMDRYRPEVVLDLHEFTVAGRWVDKFGGMMKYDALLQPATVANLDPKVAAYAQTRFIERIGADLAGKGLTWFAYHTTAAGRKEDKTVSMGGVQPDTGRNVGGLRPGISMLIEVRGVGIGRAHFLRRVYTQVSAAQSVIETAASQGPALIRLVRDAQADVSASRCRGDLVIEAAQTPMKQRLVFVDAKSGDDLPVEVDWRSATPLQVVRSRPRPCGYLLAPEQTMAIERLRLLGVKIDTLALANRWEIENYVLVSEDDGQRQDGRGAIEDAEPIRKVQVRMGAASEVVGPGVVYVSLDQPLGALIAAALEPDSQSSFVANRLLALEGVRRVVRLPVPAARAGARDAARRRP
ncbi:M14 family metallocarboxypeptidase [Hydrogenophaga sp.]|uniref:M14 family metallopeptidase n=1 Tax=Hydrogenophaga sp. TaxID=1904254 RepID=UPI002717BE58|nr:M14 family metallocarboxypeptidase [Hydrogenophaga sp.]MDO9438853.1 M14 family metallocarboxypeptidase [Hydrogenophaga sp.]